MPNRILRDWTDSEPVNSLSWQAECLFIRLIMKADDYGCFHANPRLLKSLLFPLRDGLRDTDITRWIAECEKAGLLRVYSKEGKSFLVIEKYEQRLKQSRRKFPEPPSKIERLPGTSWNFRELPARNGIGNGDGTPPCGGDSRTHAHNGEDPFPHSVDEVLEMAKEIYCGQPCSREQADAYFTDRVSKDWTPYGQQRMKTRVQICMDLKKWLMRDQDNERRQQHGDNRNNFSAKYDEADDGSNV